MPTPIILFLIFFNVRICCWPEFIDVSPSLRRPRRGWEEAPTDLGEVVALGED